MKRWRIDGFARRFIAAGLAFLIVAVAFAGPDVSRAGIAIAGTGRLFPGKAGASCDDLCNEIATGKIPARSC